MANVIALFRDSLTNLVSRMGTDRDKAASSFYGTPLLDDLQLLNAYRGAWLPRKIVDIPAFDSVRAWRNWQADGEQIEPIEAEEKRLNVRGKVLEARIKARLWGGVAIHIGTGDQDLSQPLNVEAIKKGGIKYLTVLTRRQLAAGEIERDPASEWYGTPKSYDLTTTSGQIEIHPSRLVVFAGNPLPDVDLVAGGNFAWGDSVLLSVLDAIKNADSTAGNIASLIFEAKIDIIRVPNFMASLRDEGYKQKILERFTLANTAKGINGTLILDKEEEYESKQATFATLPDVLDRFLQIVSGAADIPATRLLGQSPAGMNSTGESDLRNYYDRLQATQQVEMTPAMYRLDECLIRSALGSRPADVYYEWAPLWGLSDTEKATIFKTKADAARALAGSAAGTLLPVEALSDALVNTFVEDGSLPGLEAAIEEYGSLAEQEPSEEDIAAAAVAPQAGQQRQQAADAAPRTLYVRRDVLNAAEIIAHFKAQGFETTLPTDDLHITITSSRTPVNWMKMGENWSDNGKGGLTIQRGGARLMERFGKATVLLFASSALSWRHEDMMRNGATWDHPEYQPHVTISYEFEGDLSTVEPWTGEIVLGPEVFEEVKEDWKAGIVEDAEQPRVPAGSPDGGQFASAGSSNSLSVEQVASIKDYTASSYRQVNGHLRGGQPATPEVLAQIAKIDSVLDSASLPQAMTVYRGAGSLQAKEFSAKGLRKGSVITDAGFLSTSTNRAVASNFAGASRSSILMEIRAPKGVKALNISHFSDSPGENEVLFARSTRMKVVSFNSSKRVLVVEVLK